MNLGIIDINGRELSCGDRVASYIKRYDYSTVVKLDDDIYEIAANTKVKPILDVPVGVGSIVYRPEFAAFRIRYDRETEAGFVETMVDTSSYFYEVI